MTDCLSLEYMDIFNISYMKGKIIPSVSDPVEE